MPLDPNIALQVRGLELPNPLAQLAQTTQIQNALQQQRMGEIQMQNALREQQRKQKLETILGGFGPDAKAPDMTKALIAGGFLPEARTLMQSEAQLEETRRKAKEAEYKGMISQADLFGRVMGALNKDSTQEDYNFALSRLKNILTPEDVAKLGDTFDYNRVRQFVDMTMSQKDRLEAAFKERTTAATEATAAAAGRRAVAAEKQAMTAADEAAWKRANPGFDIQETATGFVKVNKRTGETTPLTMEGGAIGEAPVQLQPAPKGSRPQLLQLQDEQRMLEARGEGDTPRAREIRDQIRAVTSKGAPELSPKDIQAREAKYPQATLALRTFTEKTDDLIKDIKTLQRHAGLEGITGVVYGRTPSVTAESRAAQALLEKIMARGGFQELQNLRNSSPTGGALGQVSNQENAFLRQAFGALNTVQDTKDFRKALGQVIQELEGSKSRLSDAYDLTYEYRKQQRPDEEGLRSGTKRSIAPTSTVPSGGATLKFDASGKLIE